MKRSNGLVVLPLLSAAALLACNSDEALLEASGGSAGSAPVTVGGAAGTSVGGGSGAGGAIAGAGGSSASDAGVVDAAKGLLSFTASTCKKKALSRPAAAGDLAISREALSIDAGALDGLKCLSWSRAGTDGLRIDLVNFREVCETLGHGSIATHNGGIDLLVNVTGGAYCGYCTYDWSFDLGGIGSADLPVSIRVSAPGDTPLETHQVTLPLSGEPQGAFCQYAPRPCGAIGMPCNGTAGCGTTEAGVSCNAGLTCDQSDAADRPLCLQPCTSDAECSPSDAVSCQAGFCRPVHPW